MALARAFKRLVMKHAAETEKVQSADRIGRGFGAIIIFLHPHADQRISGSAAEIASTRFIPEQPILSLLKFQRPFQPIASHTGFVKVEQALNEERVVFGKTGDRAGLATPASQKPLL